ncbi:MAG: hypothetical protein U0165_07005 [Polyangiaceae bacterium]
MTKRAVNEHWAIRAQDGFDPFAKRLDGRCGCVERGQGEVAKAPRKTTSCGQLGAHVDHQRYVVGYLAHSGAPPDKDSICHHIVNARV